MGWIGRSLDPATVSALAAILGSFAGASCINPERLDYTEASRPKGPPGQEDCTSRAIVFRLYQRKRASYG